MAKLSPSLYAWYQDAREDEIFEVVAIDEQEGTIEIQYYDGDVGEIDFESWQQMVLLPAQPPEDWRNADELESNESGLDSGFSLQSWEDPLSNTEPSSSAGYDEF